MESPDREPDLPARVYWIVVAAAVLTMVLLAWFTSSWNLPLPPSGEASK